MLSNGATRPRSAPQESRHTTTGRRATVKRIRWFAAKWPIALRTLATKMKSHPFREDSLNGFIIERVRDNFINGRYVEKISYQETLTTPFGDQQIFDRTE